LGRREWRFPLEEIPMRRVSRSIPFLLAAVLALAALSIHAQTAKTESKQPPTARIVLVRLAPGKQLDFLKWAAENEAIAKEAGVPADQVFAHTNGDSWDYMQIAPDLTKEQQAKVDEITKKHGRKTGFPASLEFRTFVAWHTDTMAIGPTTATDLAAMAGK
jgi:hypothetical protein